MTQGGGLEPVRTSLPDSVFVSVSLKHHGTSIYTMEIGQQHYKSDCLPETWSSSIDQQASPCPSSSCLFLKAVLSSLV